MRLARALPPRRCLDHNGRMNRRGLFSLGLALGTWLLAWSPPLLAAEGEEGGVAPAATSDAGSSTPALEADALIQRGIELRKAGDDRRALSAFERAFSLGGSPRALAQMALAEQALGLWPEANEHLERALGATEDRWISEHRAVLEAASQEIASQLGALELSCNVAGAEVRVDGRVLGRTPLAGPVRLVAGASVIQVSSDGHFDVVRRVNVDAGQLSRLNVILTPTPAASPLPTAAVGPQSDTPSPTLTMDESTPSAVSAASADSLPPARDVLLYTTLGLAALGTSVGVTGYVMREVNVEQYNDDRRCSLVSGTPRSQECPEQEAAFRRGEVLAIAGFSSAAVFGLVAAYLWWDRAAMTRETSFVCALGPAMAGCQGRF